MKKILSVNLELLSPLSIPVEERAKFPSCNDYISGSAIRGAIAAQYLREKEEDSFFRDLFSEETVFNNLYPVSEEKETFLLPSGSVTCKRYGPEHGIKDNLWLFSAQELHYREKGRLKKIDHLYQCNYQNCTHDLKSHSGFVNIQGKSFQKIKLNKQIHIHSGINRESGNIQEKIFYSLEEISNPATFNGTIEIEETMIQELKKFTDGQTFFLGKNKTRGNGRVKLIIKEKPVIDGKSFGQRLDDFNLAFQRYLKEIFDLDKSNYCYFSLDFLSDAIIVDKYLRYTNFPEELMISDLVYNSAGPVNIKGWNSLWQLPKESETGIKKGSSYMFGTNSDKWEETKLLLEKLELNSLGLRKNEGFGKLIISDDFHNNFAIRG